MKLLPRRRGAERTTPTAAALGSLVERLEELAARLEGSDRAAVETAAGLLRELGPQMRKMGVLK